MGKQNSERTPLFLDAFITENNIMPQENICKQKARGKGYEGQINVRFVFNSKKNNPRFISRLITSGDLKSGELTRN